MIELMAHQEETRQFLLETPRAFITSSPGVGKTISCISAYDTDPRTFRMLVLAPLSILKASWYNDVLKWNAALEPGIAHGTAAKREKVIKDQDHQIVITNHDAVKWIAKDESLFDHFDVLVIDEFTAFKNSGSQRSKALKKIAQKIGSCWMLSGTPTPNTVLDIWYPAFLLDKGQRLGKQFFRFRGEVCESKQVGPDPRMVEWKDKPYAQQWVTDLLADITIRHRFEDCVDIPENTMRTISVALPPKIRKAYNELEKTFMLEMDSGETVTAVHAGAKVRKLLQVLTGCVYDEHGEKIHVHDERYNLVTELVKERDHSVVAYNWKHERDHLKTLFDKEGITYGVIDGDASAKRRAQVVEDFQAGKLQVVLAHPQAAGHGLTLTKGRATIWCSPTYNAEHYQQFNARIYRNGQTKKTETILIAAEDSKEEEVYDKLNGKLERMDHLLDLFLQHTKSKAA